MIDKTGRVYQLRTTQCLLCGGNVTYTHKKKLSCESCQLNRTQGTENNSKKCSVCQEEKPLSDYYQNSRSQGGYYVYCKKCSVEKRRNNIKSCKVPFCDNKTDGGKFCPTHRRWLALEKPLDTVIKHPLPVDPAYFGPTPQTGEKAIYVLKRPEDGVVFYVGSSKNPKNRLKNHRLNYGNIKMATLMCVPQKDVVYWEAKTLVECIDAGCPIINCESPVPNNRGNKP